MEESRIVSVEQSSRTTRPSRVKNAGEKAVTLLAVTLSSTLLYAQPPTEMKVGASAIEEIVVTARRREESLQEVPSSITVLSEENLRIHKIDGVSDLRHHAPSLTVSPTSYNSNEPLISLRGQRPVESTLNFETPVHFYFSDVVMSPATGTNMSLYDLESVQVLKGPQGTLFGKNSTGGAVLLSPTRPGDEFGGYAEVTSGDFDLMEVEAAVDIPISDRLKVRISGRTVNRDGYQTVVNSTPETNGQERADEDADDLRFSMLVTPTEDLENHLVINWSESDEKGPSDVLVSANPDNPIGSIIEPFANQQIEMDDPWKVVTDLEGAHQKLETWFGANTTTWNTERLEIKNVLGYRNVEATRVFDTDITPLAILHSVPEVPSTTDAEQFSEEFQVQGTAFDERLDWISGVYFYSMEGTSEVANQLFGGNIDSTMADLENESYAVFAQGSYALMDQLSLTLGARRSWDKRELTPRSYSGSLNGSELTVERCSVFGESGNRLPVDNCARTVKEDWNADTWLASLDYSLSDQIMFYGSIATGYKSGGFNIRSNNNVTLRPFDEENVITYELGLKSDYSWGNILLRNNLAVYTQDYEDIQRSSAIEGEEAGTVVGIIANAAEATVEGLEYELSMVFAEALDISLSYAYVNTEYDSYLDTSTTPSFDRAGERFPGIPENQATATIRYILPLDSSIGELSVQANFYYQSKHPVAAAVPDVRDQFEGSALWGDSYSLQNYRVDWRSLMGSSFDVAFYLKNASDEEYVTGGFASLDAIGFATKTYGPPRTWGGILRYSF